MKSIYVGNLSFDVTSDQVKDLFSAYGEVVTVKLISDRDTGQPRGFAFVVMADEAAQQAVEAADGLELGGRSLRVNFAKPRGVRRLRRPR